MPSTYHALNKTIEEHNQGSHGAQGFNSPSDTALAFSKATWDEENGQKATRRTTLWNLPRLSTHSSTCGEKDEWVFF